LPSADCQIGPELHQQRLVEAEFMADIGDRLAVALRPAIIRAGSAGSA
jgi:hypothetical protein